MNLDYLISVINMILDIKQNVKRSLMNSGNKQLISTVYKVFHDLTLEYLPGHSFQFICQNIFYILDKLDNIFFVRSITFLTSIALFLLCMEYLLFIYLCASFKTILPYTSQYFMHSFFMLPYNISKICVSFVTPHWRLFESWTLSYLPCIFKAQIYS